MKKTITRRQKVLRRRKIVKTTGNIFLCAGFILAFIASATEEFKLILKIGIIAIVCMVVGTLLVRFIEQIEEEEEQRRLDRSIERMNKQRHQIYDYDKDHRQVYDCKRIVWSSRTVGGVANETGRVSKRK